MRRDVLWRRDTEEDHHEVIECAVGADGASPASDFVAALKSGQWLQDDEFAPRDTDDIVPWASLLAVIEDIGKFGQPQRVGQVNDLEDGVWEFRAGIARLTYWDTDGDGTFDPKPRIDDIANSDNPDPDGFWWYPGMDPILRVGCGWKKTGELAPQDQIEEAITMRSEDCEHDKI